MVQMKPSPILFFSFFFFFLKSNSGQKSFHQKNRCHLLWSLWWFYFILLKKFSPTEEAHLNIMKGQQESSHRGGSDSV